MNCAAISATSASKLMSQPYSCGIERRRGARSPSPCRRRGGCAAGRRRAASVRGSSRSSIVAIAPVSRLPSPGDSAASIAATSFCELRFELREGLASLGGEAEAILPPVGGQRLSGDQPLFVEILHDAAEIAGIEAELDRRSPWPRGPRDGRARRARAPRSARTGSCRDAGRARRACGYRSG